MIIGAFGTIATAATEITGQPFWLSFTVGALTGTYLILKIAGQVLDIRHKLKAHKKQNKKNDL